MLVTHADSEKTTVNYVSNVADQELTHPDIMPR